jgi:hypothetical protein
MEALVDEAAIAAAENLSHLDVLLLDWLVLLACFHILGSLLVYLDVALRKNNPARRPKQIGIV